MFKNEKFPFLNQVYEFIKLKSNLVMLLFVILFSVVLLNFSILETDSNNYTWIFSASMQTLAALIALLPISFSFYLRKIEDQKTKEFDSYILKRLEKDVYYEMMFVIMFSLFAIIVNLGSLFFDFYFVYAIIATALTLLSVSYVIIYIYRLFDPDRIFDVLMEFDTETETVLDPEQKVVTLDVFITDYLTLETVVKDYISNENDNSLIDKLPLYDIVDNLSKDFPVIEQYFQDFKEIIFHRNNLIHNYNEVIVDYNKYLKIKWLTQIFEKHNDKFITDKIFSNVTSVKNLIEMALSEYLTDYRNIDKSIDNIQIQTYEETLSAHLQSHFISDYYETLDFDESGDTDFEVIQNNFSNRKLVGIEMKMTDSKSFKTLAKSAYVRLGSKYKYLFIINYDVIGGQFEISYQAKDKKQRFEIFNA